MDHTTDFMLDLAKARRDDLLREAAVRRMLRRDGRRDPGQPTRRLRRILAPLFTLLA